MPHALQHRAAVQRAELTGETMAEATAGLERRDRHGLDDCDDGQRRFRCLLALGLFNAGPIGASPADWRVHIATCYTLLMSPRRGLLKMVSGAPINVASRILPEPALDHDGLPGLRVVAADWEGCVLRHVPTGAELVITRRRDAARPVEVDPLSCLDGVAPLDAPLCRSERIALDSVPAISADAAVLLSSLVSRVNVTDPDRRWATGMWFSDPLLRPHDWAWAPPNRRLWGAGDLWNLRWQGHPRPTDVAAALTDRRIAVDGIEVQPSGRHGYVARLGAADMVFGWLE